MAQAAAPADLPTDGVTQTTTVSGTPPSFRPTDYYPGIMTGFTSKNVPIIDKLSDVLNLALFYNSGGKIHLPWMRAQNFNFSTDVPSVDLKNLMGFAKQVYHTLYSNNGEQDKAQLTPEQIVQRIAPLKTSIFISNLSSSNPTGQLAAKLGGNAKTLLNDLLLQIK